MGGFQGGVDLWRGSFLARPSRCRGRLPGVCQQQHRRERPGHQRCRHRAMCRHVPAHWVSTAIRPAAIGPIMARAAGISMRCCRGRTTTATRRRNSRTCRSTALVSSPRLKAGYPVPLPLGPRFVLEPQAQIIWQQVSFDQANDGLGPVALGTTSGATGRLGVRGQWTIIGENGQVWQPYARANLWRDWGAEATTTFGIDPVPLIEAGDAAGVRRRRDRQDRRRCQPLRPGRLSVCGCPNKRSEPQRC